MKSGYKHPNGLPTLLHLSQVCLKRNLTQIQDVGATPYHLLEPVLLLMSSRQLNQLENLSTQLMPQSDKLWKYLIEKDFSDRPLELGLANANMDMPYKSLYYKYFEQRDEFRRNSVKRLRHMQQSLMKEKTKNKVVAVNGVLRDPSRKTRPQHSEIRRRMVNKNTIMARATRDVMTRSLMFGKSPQRRYDPYSAFDIKNLPIETLIRVPVKKSTLGISNISKNVSKDTLKRDNVSKDTPKRDNVSKDTSKRDNVSTLASTQEQAQVQTQTKSKTLAPPLPLPPPSEFETIKKRRRQQQQQQSTSIFLHKRRKPSTSPIKKVNKLPEPRKQEAPSKIKPIKSSLFS
ncbi:hypothetical protein KGF56_000134 [Candida oxycetoniae]|uniref:Elongin-A n=1 Tax=Candida oxycetoniae TaxID=497107 RepID=A0AAI9X030_9ASCO|nr:uncharacterized protein KGF56_000134 [Candida oxycetoniae]KAI3407046.2 hypothetical protein KGF56_000134 [Candida oxycetoniae]